MPKGWSLYRAPQLRTSWLPALHPGSASSRPGFQHSHPVARWWAILCPGPGEQEPQGALLLCGCHDPALHAAPSAPCGQTQWQPATHLLALPHQALTPQQMCTPTSGPIRCCSLPHPAVHLGLYPSLLSQVFTHPGPPYPCLSPCRPR